MLENILTNKYFVIALIFALFILFFLYIQNRPCKIECMRNIDLEPLPCEAEEKLYDGNYKKVGKNVTSKRKTKKSKRDVNNSEEKPSKLGTLNGKSPQPYNASSKLDQCQPCVCPEKREPQDDSTSTTDDDAK